MPIGNIHIQHERIVYNGGICFGSEIVMICLQACSLLFRQFDHLSQGKSSTNIAVEQDLYLSANDLTWHGAI